MEPITAPSSPSESPTISTIKNIKLSSDKNKKSQNEKEKIQEEEKSEEKEMSKEDSSKRSLKKLPSNSSMATNHSSDSLTPTITNENINENQNRVQDTIDDNKSEITGDHSTVTGSVYGDNKSVAACTTTVGASRFGVGNYDNINFRKRQWDEETSSTYTHSRFNDDARHPPEIASMPEGIRESSNYPTIKQIPLPYYRYGVYMYITDPVIVQTRTMMERMFSAHTIYTITVKLLRPNLPMYRNESICTFTVHKRYRQFRSFYKEIHKKYKDTINDWPEFPKKTYFDRFDSDTIKKRAFAFSSLMSFISLHPLLYNCPVLLTFLELTGSMHNPLSTVSQIKPQRQHPDGSLIIEQSSPPIEGKTIQFEGRDVAPSIPKLFGNVGSRRQYPPGYYGQTSMSPYDTSINATSPTNNTMLQLKRRSMYDISYYNQDYYSSFSRLKLSKNRNTPEFLKNRNSMYSMLSANEKERVKPATNNERDIEASSSTSITTTQTTPKLSSAEAQKNNRTSTVKPVVTSASNSTKSKISPKAPILTTQKPTTSIANNKNLNAPETVNSTSPSLTKNTNTTSSPSSTIKSTSSTIPQSNVIPNPLMDQTTISPENIDNTNEKPSIDKDTSTKGKNTTSPSSVSSVTTTASTSSNPPPVIPRPRLRNRAPRNYPPIEEITQYNHYQHMNEIPGFHHLISEFPKLRSHQNKRYSSIF